MNYRFKELRENTFDETGKEMSVMELSRKLGFNDENKIHRLEKGKFKTTEPDTLKAYADFFGVSIDYLLGLSDVRTKDENVKMICRVTGLSEAVVNDLINARDAIKAYEKKGTVNLGGLSNSSMAAVINLLVEYGQSINSIFDIIEGYFRLDNESLTLFTKEQAGNALEKKEFNLDEGLSVNDAFMVCDNGFLPLSIAQVDNIFLDTVCDRLKEIKRRLHKNSKKEG